MVFSGYSFYQLIQIVIDGTPQALGETGLCTSLELPYL
jgi:hypothetical protein